MSSDEDESIYPVANWDMGPIPQHELIVFRPHFISSPEQSINDAETSRYYALTLSQAKELAASLHKSIEELEAQGQ